jgi:putative PIN family toxin of toxin-antitoxin system
VNNTNDSIRIVIDTNVFISAIVFGGKPRQVINLVADDSVTFIMAEAIITELRRIIVSKFPGFLEDLMKVEKLLEQDAEWVKLGFNTERITRDPNDDKFIETALIGNCHYIISGDKDLLDLKEYKGIKILSPAGFLSL